MPAKKHTSGFCNICQKNVPHRRWIGNPIALLFDLLTLQVTRFFRLGPWYCVHCDNKKVFLPLCNKNAMDYRSAALRNEIEPPTPAPSQTPSVSAPVATAATSTTSIAATTAEPATGQLEPAEPVGNFIKTESSLLMKSNRLQRYSEKYRDAVVRRIFTGASSIKQVREEKQLSEAEITDWIADLFERQQQKIDALERFKKSITTGGQPGQPSFQGADSDAQTIPGQVRPR